METERRTMQDRRSGKDRRRLTALKRVFAPFQNRESRRERRQTAERRLGWVRLSKWSSVHLASLKLSKYLKPIEPKRKHES